MHRERERERETDRQKERERDTKSQTNFSILVASISDPVHGWAKCHCTVLILSPFKRTKQVSKQRSLDLISPCLPHYSCNFQREREKETERERERDRERERERE